MSAAAMEAGGPSVPTPPATAIRIVVFCMLGMAANLTPLFFATFPVMLLPMQTEFGPGNTGLTTGYAITVACLAIAGPFVGRLVDRYHQRWILFFGCIALSFGIATLSVIPASLPVYYLACAAIGIAGAGSYQIVYYSVLPNWFGPRLGLAIGLASAGTALGTAIFIGVAHQLVETVGWRETYLVLALTSLAITLPNLLLLKSPPAAARITRPVAGTGQSGLTLTQTLRTLAFWRLAACFLFICAMVNGNNIHMVAIYATRGVDSTTAASLIVIGGFSSLVAKLACGALLGRVNPARLGSVVFLAGSIGGFVMIYTPGGPSAVAAALLLGFAIGAEGDLLAYMARWVFGGVAYGAVMGALSAAFLLGVLGGPMLMSILRDVTGSYTTGQFCLAIGGLLATALHWSVRPVAEARCAAATDGEDCRPIGQPA